MLGFHGVVSPQTAVGIKALDDGCTAVDAGSIV